MDAPGKRRWVIAEGYIPDSSMAGAGPELTSHETACILNAGDREANIVLTVYFSDREPAGPFGTTVAARRTRHLRFNDLAHPETLPKGRDFACVIESDVAVVVQHTRLDSRAAEVSLMTTMAYPAS